MSFLRIRDFEIWQKTRFGLFFEVLWYKRAKFPSIVNNCTLMSMEDKRTIGFQLERPHGFEAPRVLFFFSLVFHLA